MQAPSDMHMSKSTQTSVPHTPNWPGASYGPHTSIPWNFPTGCLFDLNPMSIGPSAAAWSVPVPVNDIEVLPDFPLDPAAATGTGTASSMGRGTDGDGTFVTDFSTLGARGLSMAG